MARPGLEPMISRSEVDCANYYSIGTLLQNWQMYLLQIYWDESWPVKVLVSVLPE